MKRELNKALEEAGFIYFTSNEGAVVGARLVTAFNTAESEIDSMIAVIDQF